jgi:hypothetical protein
MGGPPQSFVEHSGDYSRKILKDIGLTRTWKLAPHALSPIYTSFDGSSRATVILVRCWFGWGWCVNPRRESKSMNPAAALGDEALGKRGEGCSPLLGRGRTVQTLAKVYEDRAAECSRAAQQTDDPVFRRLLLMLASQWKLAAQEEAKSEDAPTSLASTQPQPLDESLPQR